MKLYKISTLTIFFKCGIADHLTWKKIHIYVMAGEPKYFNKNDIAHYKDG